MFPFINNIGYYVGLSMKKNRKKIICGNCKGNGFIVINKDWKNVRQCWICESRGEVYEEEKPDLKNMKVREEINI